MILSCRLSEVQAVSVMDAVITFLTWFGFNEWHLHGLGCSSMSLKNYCILITEMFLLRGCMRWVNVETTTQINQEQVYKSRECLFLVKCDCVQMLKRLWQQTGCIDLYCTKNETFIATWKSYLLTNITIVMMIKFHFHISYDKRGFAWYN